MILHGGDPLHKRKLYKAELFDWPLSSSPEACDFRRVAGQLQSSVGSSRKQSEARRFMASRTRKIVRVRVLSILSALELTAIMFYRLSKQIRKSKRYFKMQ